MNPIKTIPFVTRLTCLFAVALASVGLQGQEQPKTESQRSSAAAGQARDANGRKPNWVVPPTVASKSDAVEQAGATARRPTMRDARASVRNVCDSSGPFNPATFIQLFEHRRGGKESPIYKPADCAKGFQLSVDESSSIEIVPDPDSMGQDPVLNKLYITAKLVSGDTSKDVVVIGYSEVGKDKATMAAQAGASFQSAANVGAMILNLSVTANEILAYTYNDQGACDQPPAKVHQDVQNTAIDFTAWKQSFQERQALVDGDKAHSIDNLIRLSMKGGGDKDSQVGSCYLARVQERFRLYQPEVAAIADFFADQNNLAIVERVGTEVFWLDRDSLRMIASQYKQNLQTATNKDSTQDAQNRALLDLLERTKLVNQDFRDVRLEIVDGTMVNLPCNKNSHSTDDWDKCYFSAVRKYALKKEGEAIDQLKTLLTPGSISLADYKAKDGDRLTVTVETVPSSGASGGIPAVFEIAIKKYGTKVGVSSSFMFLRRLYVTDAEAKPASTTVAPINRVNFAPSPGVTFGMNYFKRGDTGREKFLRALAPGMGINVSFMNFSDPSFDVTANNGAGAFVNTNGTNVQVGSGFVFSAFDNKLQVTYGWNLNVEQRRRYFGVGFGFIEIGKELAKYVSK